VLVDGIYPEYSRFVKGLRQPTLPPEELFTSWQEKARKDIERAFGVLQSKFQVMERPFHGHSLQKIGKIVKTVLILHNMCVSDRVMDGDVSAKYDPFASLETEVVNANNRMNRPDICGDDTVVENNVGLANTTDLVRTNVLGYQEHWKQLDNRKEHVRLMSAILNYLWAKKEGYVNRLTIDTILQENRNLNERK
jgi:hypothetical protein